ncbi:Histone-arginine methyltransferase carm1 [Phytophthora boehmeriae]|uniref:Histone-arginine methyltransferase carm1 n=1 Tax=Phytophthora boehmeriae TaxID=109152 RepID=A0A8T1WRL4_9STRA|nr:Histone-arginine methyltransferase carm1 [Phytophthora boehmeriae]
MAEHQHESKTPSSPMEDTEAWRKSGIRSVNSQQSPPASKDEEESEQDNPFSQYYGMLLHQQNMLQDHVRTGTYERAMLSNSSDFKDKVVLDVGTGSGILAFFAIKAGARKVYAVELSNMADCARELVAANGLSDRITVIKGKMEEVELPEQVDVVVSEPMGFFLVHERMLETFVAAGKKWRQPAPSFKMFPSIGTMFMAPFSDDSIYREQMAKVAFWQQQDFYGVNLSSLRARATENHFSQPVVGYFPPEILLSSRSAEHVIDFADVTKEQLDTFDFPFQFVIERTAIMHGLGCWFTVDFLGTDARVVLSTAPHDPGTHWYQCRLLLSTPVAVNASQSVSGNLHFVANKKFSYDIDLEVRLDGTSIVSRNHIRLHDQMYHYLYSGGGAVSAGVATADGSQQQASSY